MIRRTLCAMILLSIAYAAPAVDLGERYAKNELFGKESAYTIKEANRAYSASGIGSAQRAAAAYLLLFRGQIDDSRLASLTAPLEPDRYPKYAKDQMARRASEQTGEALESLYRKWQDDRVLRFLLFMEGDGASGQAMAASLERILHNYYSRTTRLIGKLIKGDTRRLEVDNRWRAFRSALELLEDPGRLEMQAVQGSKSSDSMIRKVSEWIAKYLMKVDR